MGNLRVSKHSLHTYTFSDLICKKCIEYKVIKKLTGIVNLFISKNNELQAELWFHVSVNDNIKIMTRNIDNALKRYNDNDNEDAIYCKIYIGV